MNSRYHKDQCKHEEGSYVGSFEDLRHSSSDEIMHFDVYVFESAQGAQVCIRYGSKDSEYISPGSLVDFISSREHQFNLARDLILKRGKVVYKKNPPAWSCPNCYQDHTDSYCAVMHVCDSCGHDENAAVSA